MHQYIKNIHHAEPGSTCLIPAPGGERQVTSHASEPVRSTQQVPEFQAEQGCTVRPLSSKKQNKKSTFSISTESSANHCLASFCCTTQATCRQARKKMRTNCSNLTANTLRTKDFHKDFILFSNTILLKSRYQLRLHTHYIVYQHLINHFINLMIQKKISSCRIILDTLSSLYTGHSVGTLRVDFFL